MPAPNDPTFRQPLKEEDLRAAKDEMASALYGQARDFGAEAKPRAIDALIAPIVEKVNRDHDELLRRGIDPNAAPAPVDPEAGLGVANLRTGELTPSEEGEGVLAQRRAARPATLEQKALAWALRKTKNDPDFATHKKVATQLAVRESQGMEREVMRSGWNLWAESFLTAYVKKYGDPRAEVLRLEAGQHG